MPFLTEMGQIVPTQYGFRENHSCDNAVSHLVGSVLKNIENKKITVGLFLDLLKAIDTLEHRIVLDKMYQYGIGGVSLDWFSSYLSNRQMHIKCKPTSTGCEEFSDIFLVTYVTPQGSCLGPLIFLIFCNDLQLHLQFMDCFQFVDDTTLVYGHPYKHYLHFCIETDLNAIQDWFYANKLTLNLNKTVYMLFQSKKGDTTDLKIELRGVTILQVRCIKFLGTWLNDTLTWKEHIQKLIMKLNTKLGLLYHGKNFLTEHTMKMMYYAQFHSLPNLCHCGLGSNA